MQLKDVAYKFRTTKVWYTLPDLSVTWKAVCWNWNFTQKCSLRGRCYLLKFDNNIHNDDHGGYNNDNISTQLRC